MFFNYFFKIRFISLFQSVVDFYDAFHKGNYCNDVISHIPHFGIIVGLLPLKGTAVYSTKSHLFTVVGSSTVNDLTSLYIGTEKGYVIQVAHSFAFCSISIKKFKYTFERKKSYLYYHQQIQLITL